MGCCCLLLEPHLSGRIPVLWAMGHGPQDALTAVAVVKNHKTTHMINCADAAIGGFFYVLGILEVSCWPTKQPHQTTCHSPICLWPLPLPQPLPQSPRHNLNILCTFFFRVCLVINFCPLSHLLHLLAQTRPFGQLTADGRPGGQLANYSTNFPICGPCQSDINIAFN